jgi:branched-chain amino acid transport system permease protein
MADLLFLFTSIATIFGIYAILAVSLNLELGYAGQPNLGKVFFFSIGAYVAGILVANIVSALAGWSGEMFGAPAARARFEYATANPGIMLGLFISALALGSLAGGAFGYLASLPALRLRGDFLAITLIAVGEVSRVFVHAYEPLAGGAIGILGVPNPFAWVSGLGLPVTSQRLAYTAVVMGIAGVSFLYAERLTNAPFGRLLKAVRDDELVADVLGKRTRRVKGTVLVIGSAMAAAAGVLYAFHAQSIVAGDYIPQVTFLILAMVLLGGVANNRGALLGALVLTLVDRFTQPPILAIAGIFWTLPIDLNYLRYIGIGLLLVLIMIFRPNGLIPEQPVRTPVPLAPSTQSDAGKDDPPSVR